MTKSKPSRCRVTTDESSLCQFSFADGRTCRMFRQQDHPSLCVFHARAERQVIESDRLGSELATTLTGRFMTATDVNFALGKLYKAIAQNRIPPRNASNLAFVGKLLLLSLDKLKSEFNVSYDYEHWVKLYVESKGLSNPPSVTPREFQSGEHQSTVSTAVVRTDAEAAPGPNEEDSAGGQA
jgi:hypothetical protein